jgi:hypothetical protein
MCSVDYQTEVRRGLWLQTLTERFVILWKACVLCETTFLTLCTRETNVVNKVVTEVRVGLYGIRFLTGTADVSLLQDVQAGSGVSLG